MRVRRRIVVLAPEGVSKSGVIKAVATELRKIGPGKRRRG